jgi:hypothetical protein
MKIRIALWHPIAPANVARLREIIQEQMDLFCRGDAFAYGYLAKELRRTCLDMGSENGSRQNLG